MENAMDEILSIYVPPSILPGFKFKSLIGRLKECYRRANERSIYWPLSSERTACGAELAWAMAAREACCRTWALVRLAASAATSASRMRDSAAEKLEICDCARPTA